MVKATKALALGGVLAMALVLSARPSAQSAYGDLGGGIAQLNYYAETYASLMWIDARGEAWINGDPAGASWWQGQSWAWVNVSWDGDFCGDYTGHSNHWEIDGWQW